MSFSMLLKAPYTVLHIHPCMYMYSSINSDFFKRNFKFKGFKSRTAEMCWILVYFNKIRGRNCALLFTLSGELFTLLCTLSGYLPSDQLLLLSRINFIHYNFVAFSNRNTLKLQLHAQHSQNHRIPQ